MSDYQSAYLIAWQCALETLTLAAEDDRDVPQLGHVESLKDLTLVAGTITVKSKSHVGLVHVLVCEGDTSTDGNLSTDDTISTVEASREHVHGTTLAVCNTLSSTQKFSNDGPHGTTTHHGETVTSVGGDQVVLLGNGVLDSDSDGFLTSRQVTETSDLLLLVQSVCGHLHSSLRVLAFALSVFALSTRGHIPDCYHIVVHLLQLGLGGVEGVGWGIEVVRFEALVGELDLERLVILLLNSLSVCDQVLRDELFRTDGTFSLSTCEAAASVVTVLKVTGKATRSCWKAARLAGAANDRGANLESIVVYRM